MNNNAGNIVPESVNTKDYRRRVIVYDLATPKQATIIKHLCSIKSWQPTHWFGSVPEQMESILENCSEIDYFCKSDVLARRFPEHIPVNTWPRRDVEVIKELASFDPVLYPVFLREARKPYGMDQLAEYHEIITTWFHFIDYAKPDLLIFGHVPAHIYDYLPYLLCQQRGIPTLMLLRHHHVPGVIMPTNRFEEAPPRIAARYQDVINNTSAGDVGLNDNWQEYYKKMTGDYVGALYKSFSQRYQIDAKHDYVQLRDTIPRKFMDVITGRKSIFYARALAREILTLPRRWQLRRFYESRTIKPDFNVPYIFVPLHVQPERTSVPQGDIFGHQLLMIEILSKTLPEGWLLYVKEHPVQLYDRPVFKFFRTPAFYKELLKFPNVRLLPSRLTAYKLIQHSRAVAAVTSTTCWESLFRGKPAIIFGHVWFKFCEGVFHTPTVESCREAMAKIQAGYRVDNDKLRIGLRAIQDEGIKMGELSRVAEEIAEQVSSTGEVLLRNRAEMDK